MFAINRKSVLLAAGSMLLLGALAMNAEAHGGHGGGHGGHHGGHAHHHAAHHHAHYAHHAHHAGHAHHSYYHGWGGRGYWGGGWGGGSWGGGYWGPTYVAGPNLYVPAGTQTIGAGSAPVVEMPLSESDVPNRAIGGSQREEALVPQTQASQNQ